MKNVIVLGKGSLAIKIANWFMHSKEWNLAEIVPVIPEPDWTDSFADWGYNNLIPVIDSGDYLDIVMDKIDLVFSVYYDKIIKQDFIDKCDLILNLHNAPLPKYRGVRPINWALKNGETSHGVTIHEITAGIDTGAIYTQATFKIDPVQDEVRDVYERCLNCGWYEFEWLMRNLSTVVPIKQDEEKATYYDADMIDVLWERVGWTREESMPEWFHQQQRLESDYANKLVGGNDEN